MPCIDCHTHAFPDTLAPRAIGTLAQKAGRSFSDGTIRGLLASMDRAGIDQALICSIATKPAQFDHIMAWSQSVRSTRLIPLPSVHPKDPHMIGHVRQLHAAGFPGIKMHPYYQDFTLDDPALSPLYDELSRLGLILVLHSGFDIAFPRLRRSDPARTLWLASGWPELRLVATHLGGWDDWDEVERLLLGRPIYLEISFGPEMLPAERFRRMLLAHPADYLLFGSDSPWTDQKKGLDALRALDLPEPLFRKITSENAKRLLDL